MNPGRLLAAVFAALPLLAQTVQVAKVETGTLNRSVKLSGELLPYQRVDLHARVQGFVETVLVDRGSFVRQGDLLATLSAPELDARVAEAKAKAQAADSAVSEVRAKVAAAASTYNRLKEASATPGAISGNELLLAEQAAVAARDVLSAAQASSDAAQAALKAIENTQEYLSIKAPFGGVITERLVHPGALAGPSTGPMLRLEQVSRLRLVVAVPEAYFAGVRAGVAVPFQVSAQPARSFSAPIARIARSVDATTRTMSVELDVANASGLLAPGMYPQLSWPIRSSDQGLLVPATSVVRTTARMFVIRVNRGRAEWVDVRMGARAGDKVQVFGELSANDTVVRNATDEIHEGAALTVAAASALRN